MPDQRLPREHFQPALLQRLIDDDPASKGTLEPIERRVISGVQLRQAVRDHLAYMFNSTSLDADRDRQRPGYVARSVVNSGLPPLAGRTASSIEAGELKNAIRDAILDYEPRILPDSLRVEIVDSDVFGQHNQTALRISGLVWGQPAPTALLVRANVDLESGVVDVGDFETASTPSKEASKSRP